MESVQGSAPTLDKLADLLKQNSSTFGEHEFRYGNMIRGIGLLASELTQLVAVLQYHIAQDVQFIIEQKTSLIEVKQTHNVEPEPKPVDMSQHPSCFEFRAATVPTLPPMNAYPLGIQCSEDSLTKPGESRSLPELPSHVPKAQPAPHSQGRLPSWLSGCSQPQSRPLDPPQRAPHLAMAPPGVESDPELRRAWLVAKGEGAHRFAMGMQHAANTEDFIRDRFREAAKAKGTARVGRADNGDEDLGVDAKDA